MRLQQLLEQEPRFNGHISYQFRNNKYVYFLGYDKDSIVTISSDTDQSMWSDETILIAIDIYRKTMNLPVLVKNDYDSDNHQQ